MKRISKKYYHDEYSNSIQKKDAKGMALNLVLKELSKSEKECITYPKESEEVYGETLRYALPSNKISNQQFSSFSDSLNRVEVGYYKSGGIKLNEIEFEKIVADLIIQTTIKTIYFKNGFVNKFIEYSDIQTIKGEEVREKTPDPRSRIVYTGRNIGHFFEFYKNGKKKCEGKFRGMAYYDFSHPVPMSEKYEDSTSATLVPSGPEGWIENVYKDGIWLYYEKDNNKVKSEIYKPSDQEKFDYHNILSL